MTQIANKVNSAQFADADSHALEGRMFRTMVGAIVVAVMLSSLLQPWRVTTGLLLGGSLSLLNHHWMRTSIAAAFNLQEAGTRPKVRIWRYVIRYFVIGASVFAAYKLGLVSLPATLVGLCSFVVALFVEAFRQIYLILVHAEGAD